MITCILLVVMMACSNSSDTVYYPSPETPAPVDMPVQATYNYVVDPYFREVTETRQMLLMRNAHSETFTIECAVAYGEIGALESTFRILSTDTIIADSFTKIRVLVQDIDSLLPFQQGQYIMEFFDDILVINDKIFLEKESDTLKALSVLEKGLITSKKPYQYIARRTKNGLVEDLATIAKKFKVTQSALLLWNPRLK